MGRTRAQGRGDVLSDATTATGTVTGAAAVVLAVSAAGRRRTPTA